MVKDVTVGLFDLHQAGIVHCDIKPDNIIIAPDGTYNIIDFGSTRFASKHLKVEVYCTYAFCPPEGLAPGSISVTPALDAYSLGAILHLALFKDYLFDTRRYNSRKEVS